LRQRSRIIHLICSGDKRGRDGYVQA
jgi:hypothetical protein